LDWETEKRTKVILEFYFQAFYNAKLLSFRKPRPRRKETLLHGLHQQHGTSIMRRKLVSSVTWRFIYLGKVNKCLFMLHLCLQEFTISERETTDVCNMYVRNTIVDAPYVKSESEAWETCMYVCISWTSYEAYWVRHIIYTSEKIQQQLF